MPTQEWLVEDLGNTASLAGGAPSATIRVELGDEGPAGPPGDPGEPGESAYDVAVANGFEGTVEEWLDSLIGLDGDDGASAYEVAVEAGFSGSIEEWLASLVGPQGPPGDGGTGGGTVASVAGVGPDVGGDVPLTPADIDAATSAQGALADTAVQPGDLATVATTGAYADLSGKPTLGSAASAATSDFDPAGAASAAQAASQPLDSDLTAIAALSTTSFGRALLALADAAAARTAIGAGTSSFDGAYSSLTGKPTLGTAAAAATGDFDAAGAAAAAQAASQPVDSDLTAIAALSTTSFGRSLLTAADAAAARALIGAGTSSLAIGTTSSTAKAGDYQPASTNISDATTIGKAVLTAADAAAVRTAIGAGTSSLAIGTTGTTAAAGNDSRLSDARTPTAHATTHATGGTDALAPSDIGAVPTSRSVSAGTGLTGGGALSADRSLAADFGTGAGKVTQGNDSRLSDARTPTAHAASHASGGSDALTLDDSQITPVAPNDQTGTTYTFVLADKHRLVRVSNASAITVTIPLNSAVAFPKGTILQWAQQGAGQITVAITATGTLRTPHGAKTSAQYTIVTATKVDTDEWYVSGDTTT